MDPECQPATGTEVEVVAVAAGLSIPRTEFSSVPCSGLAVQAAINKMTTENPMLANLRIPVGRYRHQKGFPPSRLASHPISHHRQHGDKHEQPGHYPKCCSNPYLIRNEAQGEWRNYDGAAGRD